MTIFVLIVVIVTCVMTYAVTDFQPPGRQETPARQPHRGNPILPGYYADPSIVQHDGHIYIYATLDPWGDETLGCWESTDWKSWTYRELNWPTKKACTSPSSRSAMVWAPSVMRGTDGRFHMVVSVGNEVWAGVADSPVGPWKCASPDNCQLISYDFRPGYHMIDAELFLDSDGQAYLYWGSGHNWINGKCFAVKLKEDMVTFDGEVHDVTPANYFEAPFMYKRNGVYYLMYSSGNTIRDTYQVHCAIAASPFGPFEELPTSPVLVTDRANEVISPGHHAVFEHDGQAYILYHRHSVPFDPQFVGRQVCVDLLEFEPDGTMRNVKPTHAGPPLVKGRQAFRMPLAGTFSASSQASQVNSPAYVGDDNYATRWTAMKGDHAPWLQMDLGSEQPVRRQEIRPEYAWKPYRLTLLASSDGNGWRTIADYSEKRIQGSPIVVEHPVTARYLRLAFVADAASQISVWEWHAY